MVSAERVLDQVPEQAQYQRSVRPGLSVAAIIGLSIWSPVGAVRGVKDGLRKGKLIHCLMTRLAPGLGKAEN